MVEIEATSGLIGIGETTPQPRGCGVRPAPRARRDALRLVVLEDRPGFDLELPVAAVGLAVGDREVD